MAPKLEGRRSPVAALLYGAPIGFLGGLIGLGGAEFRLPVLAGIFGYAARRAVALNLAISLVTVVSALLIRGGTLSLAPVLGLLPVALAMMAGAVSAAFLGVALVHRISERLLERFILVLLVGIGTALVVEGGVLAAGDLRPPAWRLLASPASGCRSPVWPVHQHGEQPARRRRGRAHHPNAGVRVRGWHQDGGDG